MATSSATDLFETIVAEAAAESPLWGEAVRANSAREHVFGALVPERFALGVETIYEGYLLHYGRPRLFAPPDEDVALLLGDYLYAHGLVRIAATGDLAELISLCAQSRAEGRAGEGEAWAATCAVLGRGALEDARAALRAEGEPGDGGAWIDCVRRLGGDLGRQAVERASAAHAERVG